MRNICQAENVSAYKVDGHRHQAELDAEIASNIERHLQSTFTYTLDTPFDSQPDANDGTNPELGAESFKMLIVATGVVTSIITARTLGPVGRGATRALVHDCAGLLVQF